MQDSSNLKKVSDSGSRITYTGKVSDQKSNGNYFGAGLYTFAETLETFISLKLI